MEYYIIEGRYIAEVDTDKSAPFPYMLYTLNRSSSLWDESGLSLFLDHVAEHGTVHTVGVGTQFAGKRATARITTAAGRYLARGTLHLAYSPNQVTYTASLVSLGWIRDHPRSLAELESYAQSSGCSIQMPTELLYTNDALTHAVLTGPLPGEITSTDRGLLEEYIASLHPTQALKELDSALDSSTEVAAHPCTCSDFQILHHGCICGGT